MGHRGTDERCRNQMLALPSLVMGPLNWRLHVPSSPWLNVAGCAPTLCGLLIQSAFRCLLHRFLELLSTRHGACANLPRRIAGLRWVAWTVCATSSWLTICL